MLQVHASGIATTERIQSNPSPWVICPQDGISLKQMASALHSSYCRIKFAS